MKDWIIQRLSGDGALTEAVRDLLWAMPWWLPYFLIGWVVLWLFFLWLSRCRRRRTQTDVRRPASQGSG